MTALSHLRESALQEGMQQGIEQGIEQGMQTERTQIARNMLMQLHLGVDLVQQATGLDPAALERLQKEDRKGS